MSFKNSNELFSVTSTMTKKVSSNEEDKTDSTQCSPIFPGMKHCTILHYHNSNSAQSPYFPLTGDSRYVSCHITHLVHSVCYTLTVSQILNTGRERITHTHTRKRKRENILRCLAYFIY